MKNLKSTLYVLTFCLVSLTLFTRCSDDEDFDTNGVLLLQVLREFSAETIAGAEVEIYANEDDWAYERNQIRKVETDVNGEVVLQNLRSGDYFFNITHGSLNNWQQPFPMSINDGEANIASIFISENLNSIISAVEGKQWKITGITDNQGEELSQDPEYSCLLDNVATFKKSGYYSMNDGNVRCDSLVRLQEGSWWASGTTFLSVLLADGGEQFDFQIGNLGDDRFTATQFVNGENAISIQYELAR